MLLVPSLINRWYVLDLRPGARLAGALVDAGHDVFCLDWGVPEDEDRYLEWDDVVARLSAHGPARAARDRRAEARPPRLLHGRDAERHPRRARARHASARW